MGFSFDARSGFVKLVILGLGYTAGYYAAGYTNEFASVHGTMRAPTAESAGEVKLLPFDSAVETVDPQLIAALEQADCLLVSAGPDQYGDPALRRLARVIAAAPKLKHIVYLSTIGVYGDRGGASVDETAELEPVSARSIHRVEAETAWRILAESSRKSLYILRLSGIYGPGRNVLVNLRAGVARRLVKPGQVFNRIHVADIGRAIEKCFRGSASGGVYNVTDNEPAPPQDVIAYAANLMGIAPPPEQDFATAELTPMARSFYGENKRVSNVKMRDILDVTPQFPTYREGLAALWASGEGRT
jgi:nucleoside-diphosphate-sugar epimerase